MASVLLSASVERCFVSRMRDFLRVTHQNLMSNFYLQFGFEYNSFFSTLKLVLWAYTYYKNWSSKLTFPLILIAGVQCTSLLIVITLHCKLKQQWPSEAELTCFISGAWSEFLARLTLCKECGDNKLFVIFSAQSHG